MSPYAFETQAGVKNVSLLIVLDVIAFRINILFAISKVNKEYFILLLTQTD